MRYLRISALLLLACVFWPALAPCQTFMGNQEFNNAGMTQLPNNQGSQSSTATCNWATSTTCEVTATGNVTVTFSAPPNPAHLTFIAKQDTTGGRTFTLPSLVLANGVTQTTDEIAQQANAESVLDIYFDGFNYVLESSPLLANTCSGQATLSASTATISNKCCTASTNLFFCTDTTTISCKASCSAGVITITGSGATDVVNWARLH